MLRTILHLLIFTVIFVTSFLLIKRSKIVNKRLAIALDGIFCIALLAISSFLPIENLFVNFKSPEDVFHYISTGQIEYIDCGDNSCLIYSKPSNYESKYIFILKSVSGYKISSFLSTKIIQSKDDNDGSFNVYNIVGTNDYYIIGSTVLEETKIIIIGSNNELLEYVALYNGTTGSRVVLIHSYIKNYTHDFYLLINGKKIVLSN